MSEPAVRLLALLLAGCGAAEPVTAPGPRSDPLATPESAPERSEQKVRAGGVVEVQLPARLGAGYSWQPGPLPEGIALAGSRVQSRGEDADGAPDLQIFRFRALAPGRFEIRFDYRRPWQRDQPPLRSVTRIVTIGR